MTSSLSTYCTSTLNPFIPVSELDYPRVSEVDSSIFEFRHAHYCKQGIGKEMNRNANIVDQDEAGFGGSDAHPTGDQEVAGSIPAVSATFYHGD